MLANSLCCADFCSGHRMRFTQLRRRELITLLGGAADRAQPLQDDARALPSVSSMRRRMVPAQRPHWALQPRQP